MRDPARSLLAEQVRSFTPAPVHPGRPLLLRYAAAVVAWSLALALTLQLSGMIARSQFIFFWVAVLFAAWYSGFVPAVLCAVGSVLAVNYFFLSSVHQLAWPAFPEFVMIAVFMVVASSVSALTARLSEEERGAQARARELARVNEQLVQKQAELAARTEATQALLREVEAANAGLAVVNAALEESEQRWQTLADIAPVFIWTTDAAGGVTWVNRPWLAFTGRLLDDELGDGWLACVHDDDRPRVRAALDSAFAGHTDFSAEYRLRRHDGVHRWFTARGVPRHDDAHLFTGYIGSCIDISERRIGEERTRALQALGASLTSATVAADVLRSVIHDAAPAIGAIDARITLTEGAPPSVLHEGHLPPATTRFEGGATSPVSVELPLLLDGERVGVLVVVVAATRLLDDDDRAFLETVAHLCAQALGRVRLFEAEQRARREADAANRAKSDFLAQLSHELRTPLNAVGGYADLISMGIHGPVTEPQRTALARLKRAQQELLTHIDELLTFARIERPTRSYAFTAVQVAAVLREVETMVAPQAGAKGIELVVEPGPPGLAAWGDRDRVRQILLNLVTNAVKYTPNAGRVVLTARARVVRGEERRVDFDVSDSGRGIPADKLHAIFDPFVQLNKTPFEPREGVGLGLAISRRLATDMDGELTVNSQLGVGSTFRLSLRPASSASPVAATEP